MLRWLNLRLTDRTTPTCWELGPVALSVALSKPAPPWLLDRSVRLAARQDFERRRLVAKDPEQVLCEFAERQSRWINDFYAVNPDLLGPRPGRVLPIAGPGITANEERT